MGKVLLELGGVAKRFSEHFAIDDVSLTLEAGEVHVITGENGSGKSALMAMASGLSAPDAGTVSVGGRVVGPADLGDPRRLGIVYQQQETQLFDNLSVAENVFFMRGERPRGLTVNPDRTRLRCQGLFNHLEVDLDPDRPVSRLGYAEKLLVAACATYAAQSPIVIFDEPTADMGDREREVFYRLVRSLKRRGAGVFYISHRLDEIPAIGTRLTVMQQGRVTGQLVSDRADRDTVIRMMIGRDRPERYPRLPVDPGKVVLSVDGLCAAPALKDVSFQLRQGEILGLLGLMGSGRTCLANCLYGVKRPQSGTIRLGGGPVRFRHPSDALAHGLAMIPEDRSRNAIFERQDALRNISAAALARFNTGIGLDTHYMEQLGGEYFDSFGVQPKRLHVEINRFSGGNQQKIVLARWMMSMASVYIMDEPTRGIDAAARVDIYNSMNDLVAKGASIILISSETEEILGMCDRILVLAGGRITGELARRDATKQKLIDYASVG